MLVDTHHVVYDSNHIEVVTRLYSYFTLVDPD